MKILHYSLGFSPYRTGGMTKYCEDLMKEQIQSGHQTAMLWPGDLMKPKVTIKKTVREDGIISFELKGALPVALDEGIKDTEQYRKRADKLRYQRFLQQELPDVIHFHTFMGIHREFLQAAKELNIRMIYTAHDYYGLCFKTTLYNGKESCDRDLCKCVECNKYALSLWKITLMQHPLYRFLKDSSLVKKLRSSHRSGYFEKIYNYESLSKDKEKIEKYDELRKYYLSMFNLIDCFHFNSYQTKEIYMQSICPKKYCILNISHGDIKKHRIEKELNEEKVRISFFGAGSTAKGYYYLQETLAKLYNKGVRNFVLQIYQGDREINEYTRSYNRYAYHELENIMNHTDLVVVPSIWYETFSFVVLESLSYGVPVLISDRVGAKDLIREGKNGYIYSVKEENMEEILQEILKEPKEKIELLQKKMKQEQKIKQMQEHAKEIESLYMED